MSWYNPFSWRKGALSNPDTGTQSSGPPVTRTKANVVVGDERAMQISAVFGCVRLLVQSASTLPLGFYERTTDGRNALPEDHHLTRLLKYKPNNFMTGKQFRQAMMTQRVLRGNAYASIAWSGNKPVALTPLNSDCMNVKRGESGLLYEYSTEGGIKTYNQRDMFHLKGFGDGIMGMSALAYARESLGISVAADSTAAGSIGGRPSAVLETEDFPDAAQRERLREMYGDGKVTAEYKADGGLAIFPGGMKYRAISIPPDDLQLLESRQFQIPEICRFFGVPAVMVDGAAGAAAAWPASYEQQVLSFLTFGLKPYLEEWEDTIVASLMQPSEQRKIIVEHNVDGLLRTDSAGRASYYATMTQNGIMTRAEARKKENLPHKDGSDELTVQVNMTNLEDLPQVNPQGQNDAQ